MKKSSYIGPGISRYQFEGLQNKGWIIEYALEVYKRHPNIVALMELEIGNRFQKVVVKYYGWRDAKGPFLSPFQASRAEKTWEISQQMFEAGLPVPKPIAVYTNRQAGFIDRNLYISEYIGEHRKSSRIFASDIVSFAEKRDLAMKIATLTASIHQAGFIHNDLVQDNFLVPTTADGPVHIVDLTLVEKRKKITPEDRMNDIASLNLCPCHLNHDHEDCLWLYFLLAYDSENAEKYVTALKKSIQKYCGNNG